MVNLSPAVDESARRTMLPKCDAIDGLVVVSQYETIKQHTQTPPADDRMVTVRVICQVPLFVSKLMSSAYDVVLDYRRLDGGPSIVDVTPSQIFNETFG